MAAHSSMVWDWQTAKRPIVGLAPMADMTDSPFCLMAKKFGWPLVFREMVSAEALIRAADKTWQMAEFQPAERPIIQQIFGKEPEIMAAAAAAIEKKYAPEGIDINMGCPVYKIVSDFNGAALMREPERASTIVRAVKKAVSLPVSVKIRLGWSEKTECLDFVRILEEAGADAITIHGRTRAQGYGGTADWEMVGRAAARVSIPVLVNGDINTPEKVFSAVAAAGAAGALIGRAALGCPWFYQWVEEIATTGARQTIITAAERARYVLEHAQRHLVTHGQSSLPTFRKHLVWYFKGIDNIKPWREKLVRVQTVDELAVILSAWVENVV